MDERDEHLYRVGMTTSTAITLRRRAAHARGFWIVAAVFALVMAYSTVPTPLYPLYQQKDGFTSSTTTVVFAAYAVGVMLSLYLAGHVSDWLGRRSVLVMAALVSAASAGLFVLSPALPVLLVARFVNGLSIGILTATATAHLGELRAVARPREQPSVAAPVAGAANLGGLALGPLIGGLFAEFLPAPLLLPHLVFLGLLLTSAVVLLTVPETVERPRPRRPWRPQRLAAPAGRGTEFAVAAGSGFAAFGVFGLFTSLAPSYLSSSFAITDHLIAGLTTFAVFGAAALGQALLARVRDRSQLLISALCCGIGLLGVAVGAIGGIFALFLVGGVVSGCGAGLLFRGALQNVVATADPNARGAAIALYFLLAYAGLVLPVLASGMALQFLPADAVLIGFLAAAVVATVTLAVRLRRSS